MDIHLESGWTRVLATEFSAPYFASLSDFVDRAYAAGPVYPPAHLIFNAFRLCPLEAVKVVIVGQDPYHGAGQANGLSFSVNDGVVLPPVVFDSERDEIRALLQKAKAAGAVPIGSVLADLACGQGCLMATPLPSSSNMAVSFTLPVVGSVLSTATKTSASTPAVWFTAPETPKLR